MTEWLLGLVPTYGVWLVTASTFLSCLALPLPASILMLAAGGFAASGDLSLPVLCAGALFGSVAGDQAGYFLGRWGGASVIRHSGGKTGMLERAGTYLSQRGGLAIFLSRWLVSALGPHVNLVAGASRLSWVRFTAFGVAGEAVWVGIYSGTGYVFAGNLAAASAMAVDVLGMLAAGTVALLLGRWLITLAKAESRQP